MSDVLIDVDDTIAETQILFIREVNARHGTEYTYDQMSREYRETDRDPVWDKGVRDLLHDAELMATCEPSEGALDGFLELLAAGMRNHIVTARKANLRPTTEDWLLRYGFAAHVHRYHPRRDDESGTEFKVRIARKVHFEAGFDDTFEVVTALADHIPNMYMIDKPWNRGHDHELPENVVRVPSFKAGVDEFLAG